MSLRGNIIIINIVLLKQLVLLLAASSYSLFFPTVKEFIVRRRYTCALKLNKGVFNKTNSDCKNKQ